MQHLDKTLANICVKHMQHLDKHTCNIRLKTNETLGTEACNIRIQPLQHANICNIPSYSCNIRMKYLHHTHKTSEALETSTCCSDEIEARRHGARRRCRAWCRKVVIGGSQRTGSCAVLTNGGAAPVIGRTGAVSRSEAALGWRRRMRCLRDVARRPCGGASAVMGACDVAGFSVMDK
jgi:hypothetical protein